MKTLLVGLLLTVTFNAASQTDLALTTVLEPVDGCELSSTSDVKIFVANAHSTLPYYGTFTVSFSVNGAPAVVESVTIPNTAPLNAGTGSYLKNFVAQADLSACQIHTIDFEVVVAGDINTTNNTLSFNVTSDCAPTVGTINAPAAVCQSGNSGNVTLTGYNGNVDHWTWSTDSTTWNANINSSDTDPYSNLGVPHWVYAVVNSPFGICPADSTDPVKIEIDVPSDGGTVAADTTVCGSINTGELIVSGYTGNVIGWELSTNGGAAWAAVTNPSDTLTFNNVVITTLYRAVVQNGSCPPSPSLPVTVTTIPPSDGGIVAGDDTICIGSGSGTMTVSGVNGTIIGWIASEDGGSTWTDLGNNSTTQPYSNLTTTTVYAVVAQEGNCPLDTGAVGIITVSSSSLISAGLDATIVEGDSIQLNGSGGVSYTWTPNTNLSNQFIPNPFASPTSTITYTLTAVDPTGCTGIDDVTITVIPDKGIVANMISPNGDGRNDSWFVQNIDNFPESEVIIFNQYGQILFEAAPYNNDWEGTYNGETLPNGTYYYTLRYSPDTEAVKGSITIMGND